MIKIKKNPNGDTRSASPYTSFEQFQNANDSHISDVNKCMNYFADEIEERGENHDWTKIEKEELFYKEFMDTLKTGKKFTNGEWYNYHINTERHHLFDRLPNDVDFVDVLEMISDCVCAGLTRSGEFRPFEMDENLTNILQIAFQNTVQKLVNNVEVVE